jgi:hypothetical protein
VRYATPSVLFRLMLWGRDAPGHRTHRRIARQRCVDCHCRRSGSHQLAEASLGENIFITDDHPLARSDSVDGMIVMSDLRIGAFLRIKGVALVGRQAKAAGPSHRHGLPLVWHIALPTRPIRAGAANRGKLRAHEA